MNGELASHRELFVMALVVSHAKLEVYGAVRVNLPLLLIFEAANRAGPDRRFVWVKTRLWLAEAVGLGVGQSKSWQATIRGEIIVQEAVLVVLLLVSTDIVTETVTDQVRQFPHLSRYVEAERPGLMMLPVRLVFVSIQGKTELPSIFG